MKTVFNYIKEALVNHKIKSKAYNDNDSGFKVFYSPKNEYTKFVLVTKFEDYIKVYKQINNKLPETGLYRMIKSDFERGNIFLVKPSKNKTSQKIVVYAKEMFKPVINDNQIIGEKMNTYKYLCNIDLEDITYDYWQKNNWG